MLLLSLFCCEQLFALSMSQWGRVWGEGVLTATSTASAAAAPSAAVLSIRTVDADVGCGFFIFLLCSCLFLVCCFALSILYTFVVLSRNFRSLCRSLARARTHTHTDTPTLWMSVYASIDINLFLCFVALCTRFLYYLILARYFCLRIVHMCKIRIYIYF